MNRLLALVLCCSLLLEAWAYVAGHWQNQCEPAGVSPYDYDAVTLLQTRMTIAWLKFHENA